MVQTPIVTLETAKMYLRVDTSDEDALNWIKWGKAAAIRAAKTFAQTTVALLPASAMITDVDWKVVVGTAVLAAVASLLTSLAGIPEEDL